MESILSNNTNISLVKRNAIERYYNWLLINNDIFTLNGTIINNHHIKYVNVSDNDDFTNDLLEKVKSIRDFIHKSIAIPIKVENTEFQLIGSAFYEVSFDTYFKRGQYFYTYVYAIHLRYNGEELIIPFIIVEENGVPKILIHHNTNTFSKADFNDNNVSTYDLDGNIIKNILEDTNKILSTNDYLFIKIMNKIRKYNFRPASDLIYTAKELNFDTRLFDGKCDLPCVEINPEGIVGNDPIIKRILVSDNKNYKSVSYIDYIKNEEYFAIVPRNGVKGFFINEYDTMKYEAINTSIYNHKADYIMNDTTRKIEEKDLFIKSAEIGISESGVYVLHPDNRYAAFKESKDTVDIEDVHSLTSVSQSIVNGARGIISIGKTLKKKIEDTKAELIVAKSINDFLAKVFDIIALIVPTVALLVLLGPITAILYGVLSIFMKKVMDDPNAKLKEKEEVRDYFHKRIEELNKLRDKYDEENKLQVVARIEKLVKGFEEKYDQMNKIIEEGDN